MNAKSDFLALLSDYINERNVCSIDRKVDYEQIYHIAEIHSLLGILASISNKYSLAFPNELTKKLNVYLAASVIQSVKWDNLYVELTNAFEKENIRNIIVKGPVVKRYYPEPDLRSMGDLDFVIKCEDIIRAQQVMKSCGFVAEEGCVDEYKFIRNALCVELHEDLTSKDFGTGIDYKKEMQFIFDSVKDKRTISQELTDECHLLYLILHIAQHLISEGCGIRQILDVALFVKNSDISMDKAWILLKKFNLDDLAHNIFYLCNKWFDVKCDEYTAPDDLYQILTDYIVDGGTFGFNVNRENNLLYREGLQKGSKIKVLFSRVFPGKEEARSKVIWYRNKPGWLLPVAWVFRWIDLCKSNPKRVKEYFNSLFKNKSDVTEKEYSMLKQLGFYRDKC